jgi:hypothetical protein
MYIDIVACGPITRQWPWNKQTAVAKHRLCKQTCFHGKNGNPNRHERNNGIATEELSFLWDKQDS